MLKTTSAQSVKDVLPEGKACESVCLRGPATKRLAGFIYGNTEETDGLCGEKGCDCNAWDNARLLLWDYDTKADARPAAATIRQLDRIFSRALDSSMVEIAFQMDQMRYAGFGYAAKRNGKWTVKNLAGFCAGTIPVGCRECMSSTCGACDDYAFVPSAVWSICASENDKPDVSSSTTAAYGKWTIDWSPTVYYRVQDGKSLIPGPAWDDIEPVPFGVVP